MPRVGQNPLKWIEQSNNPQRITITTIVHIPVLDGYWSESLQVLQRCVDSLHANTQKPFDLMVFDNGSCDAVQTYLADAKEAGKIQYLILSAYNLRKIGALEFLLACAPGEIVSFTDSDVYFLPGWLDESLRILETFPEVGQVTTLPTADRAQQYCASTYAGIADDPTLTVQHGNLIPDHFITAHAVSLGMTREKYDTRLAEREDTLVQRGSCAHLPPLRTSNLRPLGKRFELPCPLTCSRKISTIHCTVRSSKPTWIAPGTGGCRQPII